MKKRILLSAILSSAIAAGVALAPAAYAADNMKKEDGMHDSMKKKDSMKKTEKKMMKKKSMKKKDKM